MKFRYIVFIFIAVFLIFAFFGLDDELKIIYYEIQSNKVTQTMKFCLVTDLHSCDYGDNQVDIMSVIKRENPDAVLLAGDIIDDEMPEAHAEVFLKVLGQSPFPSFYVSGNHEYWSDEIGRLKAMVESNGIEVLEGDVQEFNIRGDIVDLCGVDDVDVDRYESNAPTFNEQLKSVCNLKHDEHFSVLISHRPERIDDYLEGKFDLITSGHAHGGQWRVPGLINGVLAPNQGLFPKYAGGRYDFDQTTFIVSRGLARESTRIPRLYNPPELIFIMVKP